MWRPWALAAFLLFLFYLGTPGGDAEDRDGCNAVLPALGKAFRGVAMVIDGDSICVDGIEVRLDDFSAPEWNEPGGRGATRFLQGLIGGHSVSCTGVGYSYDRIVARCYFRGRPIGDLLRQAGIKEGGR